MAEAMGEAVVGGRAAGHDAVVLSGMLTLENCRLTHGVVTLPIPHACH